MPSDLVTTEKVEGGESPFQQGFPKSVTPDELYNYASGDSKKTILFDPVFQPEPIVVDGETTHRGLISANDQFVEYLNKKFPENARENFVSGHMILDYREDSIHGRVGQWYQAGPFMLAIWPTARMDWLPTLLRKLLIAKVIDGGSGVFVPGFVGTVNEVLTRAPKPNRQQSPFLPSLNMRLDQIPGALHSATADEKRKILSVVCQLMNEPVYKEFLKPLTSQCQSQAKTPTPYNPGLMTRQVLDDSRQFMRKKDLEQVWDDYLRRRSRLSRKVVHAFYAARDRQSHQSSRRRTGLPVRYLN
jgi:hypothetical protein